MDTFKLVLFNCHLRAKHCPRVVVTKPIGSQCRINYVYNIHACCKLKKSKGFNGQAIIFHPIEKYVVLKNRDIEGTLLSKSWCVITCLGFVADIYISHILLAGACLHTHVRLFHLETFVVLLQFSHGISSSPVRYGNVMLWNGMSWK